MIYYNLSGMYEHFTLNKFIIELYQTHPEFFREGVKIGSIFGNFQYCIWDGGRNFPYYNQVCKEDIESIAAYYNLYNIPLRLIFTNSAIEEEHLYDRFCNLQVKLLENGKNEIVVNSPLLEQYLRDNYPNYKYISSTTKCLKEDKFLEELKNPDYYQVCLDYNLNKNIEMLEKIPKELRGKCEFLTNAICHSGCPIRKKHYYYTSLSNLTYCRYKYDLKNYCKIQGNINEPGTILSHNNLSWEEIQEYNKMGYKYFKFEGRTLPSSDILANYLYYLFDPKYIPFVVSQAACIPGIFFNNINSDFYLDFVERTDALGRIDKNYSVTDYHTSRPF